ncbi:hypothetical protein [Senegalia massiliensis]|nr:hypothetical protein [Senegalia massiliensis]
MKVFKGIGRIINLETAQEFYEKNYIATIVSDGSDISVEKEPTSSPAK